MQTDKQKVFGLMLLKELSVMMQVRELLESLLIFHLFGLLLGHCSFYEDPEQPEGNALTHTLIKSAMENLLMNKHLRRQKQKHTS